jgi:RNA 3'-terminal phosphate cyclase (ATP)
LLHKRFTIASLSGLGNLMLTLDGAKGEGGGQILRSALSISILTQEPFVIKNIRAGRKKPGLAAQHLTSVTAAAQICRANVQGAEIGSMTLQFEPQQTQAGRYSWDVKTAGATTLVLQTVFLPLARPGASSEVTIFGGTHVPWSPCYHFLQLNWLHFMRKIGFNADIELLTAGYYPQGGGQIRTTIEPVTEIAPLNCVERGKLIRIKAISAVSNLTQSIAVRQANQGQSRLRAAGYAVQSELIELPAKNPGTMYLLLAEFEHSQCCYFGLGARGKPAEKVADEAVDLFLNYMETDAALDERLADQVVLPLALSRQKSFFTTSRITQHLLTNLETLRTFNFLNFEIDGAFGAPGKVTLFPNH